MENENKKIEEAQNSGIVGGIALVCIFVLFPLCFVTPLACVGLLFGLFLIQIYK